MAGQLLQNRRKTVWHLRIGWIQNVVQASNSTVQRRLKEAGLVALVALQKPLLRAVPHKKRLQFAMAHTDWTWVDWSIVLWSDESRFTLFQNDGCVFVRRAHEAYRNSCVVPTVKFGGSTWCDCVECNVIQRNCVSHSTQRQLLQGWLFGHSQ